MGEGRRTAYIWVTSSCFLLFARQCWSTAGRATYYGVETAGQPLFTVNNGSCACKKRGGIRSACASGFCFDYIGVPQPAPGQGLVTAINTDGMRNTDQCGQCVKIKCVNGPTRGLPDSEFPYPACKGNDSVTVMVTDSCPCQHSNPSNQKWCCGMPGNAEHFDLSFWAFQAIADVSAGVIDLEWEWVPSRQCRTERQAVNTATCNKYHGVVLPSDLWKMGVGVVVCLGIAGICAGLLVKAWYW